MSGKPLCGLLLGYDATMDVRFTGRGIHLPALDLWLDPSEGRFARAFVSHGHADHIGAKLDTAYCSEATGEIYALRGGARTERRLMAWGVPVELGDARLTAYPAGHILGAAQLLVERGGERFVYTGDLKLAPPLCADAAVVVPCDHLVIESTFALPIFRFLGATEAAARIVAHARECLAAGVIPLFPGYPLGRSQELVAVLSEAGVPVAVDASVAKFLPLYRRHTGRAFACVPLDPAAVAGHAVVAPSNVIQMLRATHHDARVAYVSGWARLANRSPRGQVHARIAYSDHAGFRELLEYVERSGARRVDVVHGYAEVFAGVLRRRGLDARAVDETGHVDDAAGDA